MVKRDDETGISSNDESGAADLGAEQEGEWHEDQAPVDDFEDSEASDDASAEVEDGDFDVEDSSGETALVNKKATWIPIIIGILAIGLVGTLAYFQFGGSSSNDAPKPLPVAEVLKNAPPVEQNAGDQKLVQSAASANNTGDADVSTLYAGGKVAGTYNAADPNAAGGLIDNAKGISSDVMTLDAGAQPANTLLPAPQAATAAPAVATNNTQKVDASAKKSMEKQAVVTSATPVMPTTTTPAAVKTASQAMPVKETVDVSIYETKIAGMASRIEGLEKALSTTAKQLEQMNNTVANIQAAGVKTSAHSEKNKKAEKAVETKGASTVEPAADEVFSGESQAETAQAMPAEEATKAAEEPVKKEEAKKSAAHEKTQAAKSKTASTHWVLRAATDSAAWVAKSANSVELRQVEVGQTLAGIGRVKSIRQNGERWEVVGTKGVLR
jgi:hypothetical protein